jgi:acetyltransferase-like isoleucine patch superfamily enzyme
VSVVTARDHAFAGGPVFARPTSWWAAYRVTGCWHDARALRGAWSQFAAGARLGDGVRLAVAARLINLDARDRVEIGAHTVVRGILRNEAGGRIRVGSHVYVGDDVIVSAGEEVVVGADTLLAHGVQVFDNDSHPLDAAERARHFRMILGLEPPGPVKIGTAAVSIGERCWIGMQSLVMKGVTIGDEAIVAAGSVVATDIPARVLAGGNPARVIKSL